MENFNPQELQFCSSNTCEVYGKCLDCIVLNASATKEGQMLEANPPRYSLWTWEDEGLFRVVFGEDVDPLRHGIYQAKHIALPMIEMQNQKDGRRRRRFTKQEAKLLLLAHTVHDLHEGITGDIPAPQKNDDINRSELEVNQQVVASMLNLSPDDPFMGELREVMAEGDSFLSRAFSVGEQCGYFLTGVKAWSLRNHQSLTAEQREKCEDMGRQVSLSAFPSLLEGFEFPYCDRLLEQNAIALGEME